MELDSSSPLPVVGRFSQTMFSDPVLADRSEARRLLTRAANPLREDAGDGYADEDPDPAYRHVPTSPSTLRLQRSGSCPLRVYQTAQAHDLREGHAVAFERGQGPRVPGAEDVRVV
jgi:hypothetical protein